MIEAIVKTIHYSNFGIQLAHTKANSLKQPTFTDTTLAQLSLPVAHVATLWNLQSIRRIDAGERINKRRSEMHLEPHSECPDSDPTAE